MDNQSVKDNVKFEEIERQYSVYDYKLSEIYTKTPNVKGMPGMDALPLLENMGLKVKLSGVGKVTSQSLKKRKKK